MFLWEIAAILFAVTSSRSTLFSHVPACRSVASSLI